jgi:alpha-ribazole phosphatase
VPTQILLTRHGETVANAAGKFSGHNDVVLTEHGRRQARALGKRLQGTVIDAAYASDLSRARETAELVLTGRDLPVTTMPALREVSFGDWEGKTFEEVRREWPDAWQRMRSIDDDFSAPGGELLRDTRRRVVDALTRIAEENVDRTVLVAAHGGTIQIALAHVLGMSTSCMFRLATGNCGLSIVEYHRTRPLVTLINDCAHTARLKSRRKVPA